MDYVSRALSEVFDDDSDMLEDLKSVHLIYDESIDRVEWTMEDGLVRGLVGGTLENLIEKKEYFIDRFKFLLI